MQDHVEHMYADVEQCATACQFAPRKPTAEARDTGAANHTATGVTNCSQCATGDLLAHVLYFGSWAVAHVDSQNAPLRMSRCHHFFPLCNCHGEGFFTKNVFAGLECCNRHLGMERIGECHRDRVDFRVAQQFAPVLIDLGDAVATRKAGCPLLIGVTDRHHTAVWMALDAGDVTVHGDGPGSNDADADWFTHGRILLCELRTLQIA